MNGPSRAFPTAPWDLLQQNLAGGFRARARGLLGARFSLLGPGDEEFGQLLMRGMSGAEFRAGASTSEIERSGWFGARYRMTTEGATVLLAGPEEPKGGLRIFCGGKTYEAETNLLSNTATARLLADTPEGGGPGGEVRLEGGLTGRSYRATFLEGDGGTLAIAVFLLYRNVALRRTAY